MGEALLVDQRRQAVGVRLREELHATGLVELLELLQDLRRMQFQLLNAHAAQREGYFEILAMLLYHGQQGVQGRDITAFGNVADGAFILKSVIIIMVGADVEETITLQMNALVYLEI